MQPADKHLQQKNSFPVRESNALFIQLRQCQRWSSSESSACFQFCVTLALSNKVLKSVSVVDGSSTLDDFTGALILLQREIIAVRLFMQLLELCGPAVKISFRYGTSQKR